MPSGVLKAMFGIVHEFKRGLTLDPKPGAGLGYYMRYRLQQDKALWCGVRRCKVGGGANVGRSEFLFVDEPYR